MIESNDQHMQTSALFALSKLSFVDTINMALVKSEALQILQELFASATAYDIRQLAGVIIYNTYYTQQQVCINI